MEFGEDDGNISVGKIEKKAEVDVPNAVEELKQPRKYLTAGNFEVIKDAFIFVLCRKFEMAHSLLIAHSYFSMIFEVSDCFYQVV
ncbi:hypothetical protein [Lacrimispora sphenoides]|uniref:hypothetical protein n=1 Tax=Lacrimispora sphenoides TaxID=29370 RepID=UPI000AA1BC69|nr:hypothetical protein [Lacrimispora sphenoides]